MCEIVLYMSPEWDLEALLRLYMCICVWSGMVNVYNRASVNMRDCELGLVVTSGCSRIIVGYLSIIFCC